MNSGAESAGRRAVKLLVLLFFACVQLLAPQGFVPTARGGMIVLSLCTASGARTLILEGRGLPAGKSHPKDRKACPFGAAPGSATLDVPPLPNRVEPPVSFSALCFRADAPASGCAWAAPPLPPRGPPFRAV